MSMEKREYIVTGLNMLDALETADGKRIPPHMGGIPMYGFAGMRPWTNSIQYVARVGRNFFDLFDPWFTNNGIDPSGLKFVSEETPYNVMKYDEELNSKYTGHFFTGDWKDSDFWRPQPEDVRPFVGEWTKGFYLTSGPRPDAIWEGLFELRDKFNFKIMWEPNGSHTFEKDRQPTLELMSLLDMASFNVTEGYRIFGLSGEEELLDFLRRQKPELILLRCGARGLYTIHGAQAWFIPSAPLPQGERVVDVTGCGNTSTAAACCAWCERNDPLMTGIMANISANFNLRQIGPYPLFNDETMREAKKMAECLYRGGNYTKIQN